MSPPSSRRRCAAGDESGSGNARRCRSVLPAVEQTRGLVTKLSCLLEIAQHAGADAVDKTQRAVTQESTGNSHHGPQLGRAALRATRTCSGGEADRNSSTKPREVRERSGESEEGDGGPGRRVFLGDAGPDPEAPGSRLDAGGLNRGRTSQPPPPQSR